MTGIWHEISEAFNEAIVRDDIPTIDKLLLERQEMEDDLDYLLMLAAQEGRLNVLKYFISKGGNPFAHEHQPLIRAATEGHLPVVAYLLSLGANVHAGDDMPLLNAASEGHLDVVMLLCQCTDVSMEFALAIAVNQDKDPNVTRYFLSKGAKIKEGAILGGRGYRNRIAALECFLDVGDSSMCKFTPISTRFLEEMKQNTAAVKCAMSKAGLSEALAGTISNYY